MVDHDWACAAARAAATKTDEETIVLDVGPVLAIVDRFVITAGSNTPQVKAIIQEIQDQLQQAGGPRPLRIEGLEDRHWVLLDYGDFVVHVFHEETRRFYELERLWADAPRVAWSD